MKTVIYLFLSFLLFISLMGCGKETPDVPVPRDSYDISNPGLSDERVGEVKWIFSLKYGESKTLDIDGESYKITLADVKIDPHGIYPDGKFYAYLDINETKVTVKSYRILGYGEEQGGIETSSERILFTYDFLKELFAESDNLANVFESNFAYGSSINESLKIYIDACLYVIPSDNGQGSISKDVNVIFIIKAKS